LADGSEVESTTYLIFTIELPNNDHLDYTRYALLDFNDV